MNAKLAINSDECNRDHKHHDSTLPRITRIEIPTLEGSHYFAGKKSDLITAIAHRIDYEVIYA